MKKIEKISTVFMFIGFFMILTIFILLGKQKKILYSKINFYTIINTVKDVNSGQDILLLGPDTPIGKVTGFSVTKENKVKVEFFIYSEFIDKIREDSAIVFIPPALGFLGGITIKMVPGTEYYAIKKEGDVIPSNHMYEGEFLLTLRGVKGSDDKIPLLDKVGPLLENITSVLDPKGPFMRNLTNLTYYLSIFSMQLSQGGLFSVIGSNTIKTNIERMMAQINSILATSDTIMANDVRNSLARVNLLLNNIKTLTDTINYNTPRTMSQINLILFRLERMIANLEKSPLFGATGTRKTEKKQDIFIGE
ncbi:MAG TPA: hypothetical protein PKW55_00300 [Spirochaetota bacterium]|nr:hypothetical protein [Spirochaetota bacterium]HOM37798.1 hypothetical protein [Spirochaetota bacterium]HPQ49325.1 hypothetical protein [Spirochaetota bacterium]